MKLQTFGIEIRKIGNIKNLYEDVDKTLANYQIPENGVGRDISSATIAHTLQKMLSVDKYFCVCTVNNCAKIAQVVISKERMNIYNSIHCLHWNEMLPEYRLAINAMVLDDFRAVLNP